MRTSVAFRRSRVWVRPIVVVLLAVLSIACERSRSAETPNELRTGVDTALAGSIDLRQLESSQHLIEPRQIENLARAGLNDPVHTLVRDLQGHPELIPPGDLGGTMGFYDSTQIHVLNERWVYAYFEDGHIAGYGLFEFSISDGNRVRWKRVSTFIDE